MYQPGERLRVLQAVTSDLTAIFTDQELQMFNAFLNRALTHADDMIGMRRSGATETDGYGRTMPNTTG